MMRVRGSRFAGNFEWKKPVIVQTQPRRKRVQIFFFFIAIFFFALVLLLMSRPSTTLFPEFEHEERARIRPPSMFFHVNNPLWSVMTTEEGKGLDGDKMMTSILFPPSVSLNASSTSRTSHYSSSSATGDSVFRIMNCDSEKGDVRPVIWYQHWPSDFVDGENANSEGNSRGQSVASPPQHDSFSNRLLGQSMLFLSFEPNLLKRYCPNLTSFPPQNMINQSETVTAVPGATRHGFDRGNAIHKISVSTNERDARIFESIKAVGFPPIYFRDRNNLTVQKEEGCVIGEDSVSCHNYSNVGRSTSSGSSEYNFNGSGLPLEPSSPSSWRSFSSEALNGTVDNKERGNVGHGGGSMGGSTHGNTAFKTSHRKARGHRARDWDGSYAPDEAFSLNTWATIPEQNTLEHGSIFVSIASYRDVECKDTLLDLFSKARSPFRIFVGLSEERMAQEYGPHDISCLTALNLNDPKEARKLLWGADAPSWVTYKMRENMRWESVLEGRSIEHISYKKKGVKEKSSSFSSSPSLPPSSSSTASDLPCWCTNTTEMFAMVHLTSGQENGKTKDHNTNANDFPSSAENGKLQSTEPCGSGEELHGSNETSEKCTEEKTEMPSGGLSRGVMGQLGGMKENRDEPPSSHLLSVQNISMTMWANYSYSPSSPPSLPVLCVCPGEAGYPNEKNTALMAGAEGDKLENRTEGGDRRRGNGLQHGANIAQSGPSPSELVSAPLPKVYMDSSEVSDVISCVAGNVETAFDLFSLALHSRGSQSNPYISAVKSLSPEILAPLQDLYPLRQSPHGQNMHSTILAGCRITTRVSSPLNAKGPTYARFIASLFFLNQDYFMLIDSHSRFSLHWDSKLIQRVFQLPTSGTMSHYPKGYLPSDPKNEYWNPDVHGMCMLVLMKNGIPQLRSRWMRVRPHPTPSVAAAGGFLFGDAQFLLDIPFDPYLHYVFHGEEILYSARLWTYGWDLYSPAESNIFHNYAREKVPKYFGLLNSQASRVLGLAQKRIHFLLESFYPWEEVKAKYVKKGANPDNISYVPPSQRRVVSDEEAYSSPLIALEVERYGMGSNRTLEEFWEYVQLSDKYVKTKDSEDRWEGGKEWCDKQDTI